MVGNALPDDYHNHLGVFQFMRSGGLISDHTYRKLNLLCDFQSFVHPSSSCDEIADIAYQELRGIDPYSIYTIICPANVNQSNWLQKRMHMIGQIGEQYDPCTEEHSVVYFRGIFQYGWSMEPKPTQL
ncbi:Peptidase_S10 domain-containing protein [Cephalotus follicularis]|uniref:Peptidase_S10 domain-containing protein n=1 Tax=Cephalotus follicularis TaxID=3775 RepID=A0A1Q3BIF8_CEPFO|nr:Peptidase_S10 domain-containing protein [Cephalotus follicularis]